MKNARRYLLLCATVVLMCCNLANAATFQFEYMFSSGESVSGRFDGDISLGDPTGTITNLRQLYAVYSGAPTVFLTHVLPESTFVLFDEGTRLLAFEQPTDTDTLTPNFGMVLNDTQDPRPDNGAMIGIFDTAVGMALFPEYSGRTAVQSEPLSRERLSATVLTPEPATLLLVCPGLLLFAYCRGRIIFRRVPG
jgi:hypothetical protein